MAAVDTRKHNTRLGRWRSWLSKPSVGEGITAYLLLLPTLVGLALFQVGAVVASFGISFTKFTVVRPPVLVGLANYERLVTDDRFWKVLWNTTYFTLGNVPLGIALALVLAIAMNQKIKGIAVFRTVYFLPVVSSMVAVSLLWSWLYARDIGLLNWLLGRVGIPRVPWLSSVRWAMPSVIIMSIWKTLGYDMVIFLAGLQSIPPELYEAAKIDGAGSWRLFRHITIPMISPIIFFVLILSVVGSFQVFAQTYVMTQGGPLWSTLTLVYYIFQWAFQRFSMGYASALAYVLFLIIMAITLVQFWFEKRWVHYD